MWIFFLIFSIFITIIAFLKILLTKKDSNHILLPKSISSKKIEKGNYLIFDSENNIITPQFLLKRDMQAETLLEEWTFFPYENGFLISPINDPNVRLRTRKDKASLEPIVCKAIRCNEEEIPPSFIFEFNDVFEKDNETHRGIYIQNRLTRKYLTNDFEFVDNNTTSNTLFFIKNSQNNNTSSTSTIDINDIKTNLTTDMLPISIDTILKKNNTTSN